MNNAIIHENHKTPTLEETVHMLTGVKKFSKVDDNKAYFGVVGILATEVTVRVKVKSQLLGLMWNWPQ